MNRLTILLSLLTMCVIIPACADDVEPKTNAATTPTNGGTGDAGEPTNNDRIDGGTGGEPDAGAECIEGEVFDPVLGECVADTCTTVPYDCDKAVAQLVYDAAADTVTFTVNDEDPLVVAATLGGQARTGMMSEPFTIEGTIDGRVITFDATPFDTGTAYSLNDLGLVDECGETYAVTFVINSEGGRDPFCPLGG